jgi:hypothetical protein
MSTMALKRAKWPETSMVAEEDVTGEPPDD